VVETLKPKQAGVPAAQPREVHAQNVINRMDALRRSIAQGGYDLTVWRPGYEAAPSSVTIDADAMIEVMVSTVPEDNPDAAWLM
jgi:hypothetical protein